MKRTVETNIKKFPESQEMNNSEISYKREKSGGILFGLVFAFFVSIIIMYPVKAKAMVNGYPYRPSTYIRIEKQNSISALAVADSPAMTNESCMLASQPGGEIIVSMNVFSPISTESLNPLIEALCLLRYYNADAKITISEKEAKAINETGTICLSETSERYTFEKKSKIPERSLLTLYLVTGEGIYRDILSDRVFDSKSDFKKEIKYVVKKLKTLNTRYGGETTVHDLYLICNELLSYDDFAKAVSANFTEFTAEEADGKEILLLGKKGEVGEDYEDYLPKDYQITANIGNDVLMISDVIGADYMAISSTGNYNLAYSGLPKNPTLKANATIEKGSIPKKAEIPTGDDEERYKFILGDDFEFRYITIDDKPKGYETAARAKANMKTITVPCWKLENGKKVSSKYTITVNKKLVENVKCIFNDIYKLDIKFPIKYMSGYGYRKTGGVGLVNSRYMSIHSFGAAIDINPGDYDNDLFLGYGNDLRDKSNPFCIPDEVIDVFAKYGWNWGGNFSICSDTMHFQYFGLSFLQYTANDRFPVLELTTPFQTGEVVSNLQKRLNALGYLEKSNMNGKFDNITWNALKAFQRDNNISPSGTTDYITWETIINMTHDLPYVF